MHCHGDVHHSYLSNIRSDYDRGVWSNRHEQVPSHWCDRHRRERTTDDQAVSVKDRKAVACNMRTHKNTVYIIIRCKNFLIFMSGATHKSLLTTKISQSMEVHCQKATAAVVAQWQGYIHRHWDFPLQHKIKTIRSMSEVKLHLIDGSGGRGRG